MGASKFYIGLMSGTSMDGVDAVLADFNSNAKVIAHHSEPYSPDLLLALRQAASGAALTASEWLTLDQQVGEHFARCTESLLRLSGYKANQITAIGSHGQTLWHQPDSAHPNTWQAGNANIIAASTDIPTVADFRRMDMAYGGQGAPLVPAFHEDMFATSEECRIILNLGGIANITVLQPNGELLGYDTGPANCLLDTHYRHQFDKPFDRNGEWAASGEVTQALLAEMLSEPYFNKPFPKSTGPEHFSWGWVKHYLALEHSDAADLQATLTALTTQSVAKAVGQHGAQRVIACGGGVRNGYLMQQLASALGGVTLETSSDYYGVDPQQIEALAFAWLAKQRIEKTPGNMPSVTGASKACPLGAVYLP